MPNSANVDLIYAPKIYTLTGYHEEIGEPETVMYLDAQIDVARSTSDT